MKNFIRTCVLLLPLIFLTGCEVEIDVGGPINSVARKEYPTVNLPIGLRQRNWEGSKGEGSCVHAAMVNLFRWQGRMQMAQHWRNTYGNGETPDSSWGLKDNLASKLDKEGVRYAYTTDGDVEWLEWACNTRRGCGVTVMGGKHMVCLVHLDEVRAGILDSNYPEEILWVPRERFISEWQNSNGWAVTPLYTPAPPLP